MGLTLKDEYETEDPSLYFQSEHTHFLCEQRCTSGRQVCFGAQVCPVIQIIQTENSMNAVNILQRVLPLLDISAESREREQDSNPAGCTVAM